MTQLVISLTSIPPRFGYIQETLQSLLAQNAAVASINLYLPKQYRRFDWDPANLPEVPSGVSIHLVDRDYGPATKVLPAVRQYGEQDCVVLFCDDDKIYDENWAARFYEASQQHPECCIVEEGGDVKDYSSHDFIGERLPRSSRRPKDVAYRLKRILSLGRWKPRKNVGSGYVDILEGWGGVLIKPHFFTEQAFEIPDILWTVDDIWLSGQLAVNGVPIWLNAEDHRRAKGNSNEVKSASLRKYVHEGHGRNEANQACIDYFRNQFDLWVKNDL